jgi:hypothetical protein
MQVMSLTPTQQAELDQTGLVMISRKRPRDITHSDPDHDETETDTEEQEEKDSENENEKEKQMTSKWTGVYTVRATRTQDHCIDFKETNKWRQYLKTQGYVIVTGTMTQEKITELKNQFAKDLSAMKTGIDITDATTLRKNNMPGICSIGIIKDNNSGFGHSRAAYLARDAAKPVFETLMEEKDIATSFDGGSVFPNWSIDAIKNQKTKGLWLHIDQGTPEYQAVQGMVSLLPVTAKTGGLVVAPRSHLVTKQLLKANGVMGRGGNYITMDMKSQEIGKIIGSDIVMLTAPAGSIILWDSRTVHSNHHAIITPTPDMGPCLRLNIYVCFMKRRHDEATMEFRNLTIDKQRLCNHWTYIEGNQKKRKGPMAWAHLAYPRHRSHKPLTSCAMISADIRTEFAHLL